MPTISVTLPDITQSVLRPVIVDVANQVMAWTKINDIPLYFPNDDGFLTSAGTGLDNKTDRLSRSSSQRRVEVTATDTPAEDQNTTDISGRKGNTPVFVDRPLDIWVSPCYTSSQITLEFEFKTNSKEEARRWRDDVMARYRQGRYALQHQITYCYNLPLPVWEILQECHTKRENVSGYGESFPFWLNKCASNRLTVISNETGSATDLSVAERQDRIQGFFSFTNAPDRWEKETDTGLYVVRFSYNFVYQRAATVDIKYPVIVHQQMLERPFIEFVNKGLQHDDRAVRRSQYLWGLKPAESMEMMQYLKPRHPFIRLPYVDDYYFRYGFSGTAPYLTILLTQSSPQEKLAVNLKQLGDITLDEDILDFLKAGEYKFIGVPGKSIFHFDVLKGDTLLSYPEVSLDEDLNLTLKTDIDMRKPYRLRCALFTDLSFLERDALDRLREHPKAFVKIFGAINELLFLDMTFSQLTEQRRIEPWQMTVLYEAIMGAPVTSIYNGRPRGWGFGAWGTNFTNKQPTFMTNIPSGLLKAYRQARKGRMDTQVFGIASFNKETQASPV